MKSKLELRPGFFTDPAWLRAVHAYPGGFYAYALARKPYRKDCVLLNLTFAAEQFGVDRRSVTRWLDELERVRLVWRHQARVGSAHGICLHFHRAGDYTGTVWVPVEPSHMEHHAARRWDESVSPAPVRWDESVAARWDKSVAPRSRSAKRGKSLQRPPQDSSPENLPQRAAAPRTPDGARGGALTDAELEQMVEHAPEGIRETLRGTAARARDAAGVTKAGSDG